MGGREREEVHNCMGLETDSVRFLSHLCSEYATGMHMWIQ